MSAAVPSDPQLDARRRWAREQLGIPPDADAPAAEATVLAKLEEAEFVPSDSWRQAMLTLKAADAGQSPHTSYDAFQESLEAQLREEIEQFAQEFFALPPGERRGRWTELMSRPGLAPPLELRLASLSAGLHVVPNQLLVKQPDVAELAALAAELFVLRPQVRAELRRRKMRAFTSDIRRWTTAAKTLSRWYADVAALDRELVDELAHWKKRQKQMAAAAAWQRKAAAGSESRWPVWLVIVMLVVLFNVVRVISTPDRTSPSRTKYKLPDFKIPDIKVPTFPPPFPRTGSDKDGEVRWERLLTMPDAELTESERSVLIFLNLIKQREEVQKRLREGRNRSSTPRQPIEAKPPGSRSVPSPCLTSVAVSPCPARGDFRVGHYICVSSPSGGVGGRCSVRPRALSTWRARALPGVVPLRSSLSMRNRTWRIVCRACQAAGAERFVPAARKARSSMRSNKNANAATKMCAFTRRAT